MSPPIVLRFCEPSNTHIFKDEINEMENLCYLTEIEMRFSYILITKEENNMNWDNPIYQELPVLLSMISLDFKNTMHLIVILTNRLWDKIERNQYTDTLLRKRQMILNSLLDKSLFTTRTFIKYESFEEQIESIYYFVSYMIFLHNDNQTLCRENLIEFLLFILVKIDHYLVSKLHNDEYQFIHHLTKVRIHHLISNDIWDIFEKQITLCYKKGQLIVKIIKRLRKIYKI